ncbi:hypothetical protein ACWD6K_31315 [Streptomyces sp. NPDC002431]
MTFLRRFFRRRPAPTPAVAQFSPIGITDGTRWLVCDTTVCAHRQQEPAADLRKRRPPAMCGTRSGYQKHRRDGETPCTACRHANADGDRRLRNTGTTKATA